MLRQTPSQEYFEQAISKSKTLPMQQEYQEIVTDLYGKIVTSDFNADIFRKYNIKKYDVLLNKDDEPVEVFIYHANSKPYPIIEDQAIKCVTSLMLATKKILQGEGRNEDDELAELEKKINKDLLALLQKPINSQEDFSAQFEEANTLIKGTLNNLAFIWSKNHPQHLFLRQDDYIKFFIQLKHFSDVITPEYGKSNILTINDDPEVNTVQYYARGTRGENGERTFQTSHVRNKVGIPNFVASVSGYLDHSGQPIISSPGDFSHASFPAYDFYTQEKQEKRPLGYYSPESISIATKNMLALETEIRLRLTPEEEKEETPLTWINVGLLTVINDKEQQDRIYEETILAADRLRSRNANFIPIILDCGVNYAASLQRTGFNAIGSRFAYTYPPNQYFENQRSFFQLHQHILASLEPAITHLPKEENTPTGEVHAALTNIFTCYQELSASLSNPDPDLNFKSYEKNLMEEAKRYDRAMKKFEKANTPANREEVETRLKVLKKSKENHYEKMNNIFTAYTKQYNEFKAIIDNNILAFHSAPPFSEEPYRSLITVIKDFNQALDLYCNGKWLYEENNFKLQAALSNLGDHLEVINHCFPSTTGSTHTASSYNCKSRNDRSAVLAMVKDQMRAEQDNTLLEKPPLDKAKHCLSCATTFVPEMDTHGGGYKFGGKENDPAGHPNREFAKRQGKTAKWSTKKLFKETLEAIKNSYYQPQADILLPQTAEKNIQASILQRYRKTYDKISTEYKIDNETSQKLENAIFKDAPTNSLDFTTHAIQQFYKNTKSFINDQYYTTLNKFFSEYLQEIYSSISNDHNPSHQKSSTSYPKLFSTANEFEHQVDNLKDRVSSSFTNWQEVIQRSFHMDSRETQAVNAAYQKWEEVKQSDDLLDQIKVLQQFKAAIQQWIDIKHGGKQFNPDGTLRHDSRLPAMSALQEFVTSTLEKKQLKLFSNFTGKVIDQSLDKKMTIKH